MRSTSSELVYTRHEGAHGGLPGLIVELPGERKLKTNTILSIGEHSVRVEAFVCRKPDENHEGVYRFLLKRNRRLYGVAYTLDNVGDIYLVGRMALESVTADEIDRVLGQVLEAVDSDFNTLLELGFRVVDPEGVGVAGVARRVAEEPGGVRAPDRRRRTSDGVESDAPTATGRERLAPWETPRWSCSATARANGMR